MLSKMLASTVIGPSTAAAAFFWRPLEALHYADASAKIVGVFGAVLVAFALIKLTRPSVDFPNRTAVFRLGVCALISMTLPYVLMYRFYYYPPNMSIGLVSVCHSAGAFGYSLAAACIAAGLLKAWRYRIELWGVVIAAYFGILVVFGYHIQETEYVEGWNAQKLIWQRVISQCGDVSDGDTILVNLSGLPCSQMFSAAWIGSAGSGALSKFVDFPPTWTHLPEVNEYFPADHHEERGESIVIQSPWWTPGKWPTIKNGNFIFLQYADGDLRRINAPVSMFGKTVVPKPQSPAAPLRLSSVGKQILGQKTSKRWPFYRREIPYPRESG
jgi:hypothetical protein